MSSVGRILQSEREKQGRTLKEVSDNINIKEEYLCALETETFAAIPGEVFVKGFIRNYAKYLGLDSSMLVDSYKSAFVLTASKRGVRTAEKKQYKQNNRMTRERKKSGRWPEITIIAGVVLFVLLCLWLLL